MSKDNSKYLIEGKTAKWEVVIGLEVHAQYPQIQNYFQVPRLNLVLNQIHK